MVGRFSPLAAIVIACGAGCARAPAKPPELYEFSLGGLRAPNRAYWSAGTDPCRVSRTLVADEARAMNALLTRFLEQTALSPDSEWPAEQLALLEEGARMLPPELDVYERTLTSLSGCKPDPAVDVAALAAEGQKLVEQSRARLPNAAQVVANVRMRQAKAEWRQKELAAQSSERQAWCPPKPKPIPDIFYAWEDENGRLEWLFCDGSRVVAEANSEPEYVPPETPPRVKAKQTPAGFVKAAKSFPESEIRRPPSFDQAPAAAEPVAPAEGGETTEGGEGATE